MFNAGSQGAGGKLLLPVFLCFYLDQQAREKEREQGKEREREVGG